MGTYQVLKLVCTKFIVVVDYSVVSGSAGPLDTSMRHHEEVKAAFHGHSSIDYCSSHDVGRSVNLFFIRPFNRIEPMKLLDIAFSQGQYKCF